jgi:transcriptional regulator with XRE-family HTH domain
MKSDVSLRIDNINTPKKAGLALKRLRKQQNLTQADLAKMMNMRQPTISDVESGKGTLDSFFKIVQALKLNLELSSPNRLRAKINEKNRIRTVLSYLNEV